MEAPASTAARKADGSTDDTQICIRAYDYEHISRNEEMQKELINELMITINIQGEKSSW